MKKPKKNSIIEMDCSMEQAIREAGQAALSGMCHALSIRNDADGESCFRPEQITAAAMMSHIIGVAFCVQHFAWLSNGELHMPDTTCEDVLKVAHEVAKVCKSSIPKAKQS